MEIKGKVTLNPASFDSIDVTLLTVKVFVGTLGGIVAGWSYMVQALLILSALDFLSGVAKACYLGTWISEIGRKGIAQKLIVWLLIAACHVVDGYLPDMTGPVKLGPISAGFYAAVEFGSIIENVAACGVSVPTPVKNMLAKLKEGG